MITYKNHLEIYVKYNSDFITMNIIKMKILLFLDLLKTPSMVAFDKYSQVELLEYHIIIEDLCCEYCLKDSIEELFMMDGIDSACSNFDFINKKNITITIQYNPKILNKNNICKLETELNKL